jgi:hypothetical protein
MSMQLSGNESALSDSVVTCRGKCLHESVRLAGEKIEGITLGSLNNKIFTTI